MFPGFQRNKQLNLFSEKKASLRSHNN